MENTGCTTYTTARDAHTALTNSGYINWHVGEDAHLMTDEDMDAISRIMWRGQLCAGHGVKLWIYETQDDASEYDGLPDGDICEEEEGD